MAQVVARYLGVVEVVGSSPVTPTTRGVPLDHIRFYFVGMGKVVPVSPKVSVNTKIRYQINGDGFFVLAQTAQYIFTFRFWKRYSRFSEDILYTLFYTLSLPYPTGRGAIPKISVIQVYPSPNLW